MAVHPIIAIRKAAITTLRAAGLQCGTQTYQIFDTPVFGSDPQEIPCIQVSWAEGSGIRKSESSQRYDADHKLMVRAIVEINGSVDNPEVDLADACATVAIEIKDTLLPGWRSWADGARRVDWTTTKLYQEAEGDSYHASVVVAFSIDIEESHTQAVPAGTVKIHTEVSPKPKTTAGWEVD